MSTRTDAIKLKRLELDALVLKQRELHISVEKAEDPDEDFVLALELQASKIKLESEIQAYEKISDKLYNKLYPDEYDFLNCCVNCNSPDISRGVCIHCGYRHF